MTDTYIRMYEHIWLEQIPPHTNAYMKCIKQHNLDHTVIFLFNTPCMPDQNANTPFENGAFWKLAQITRWPWFEHYLSRLNSLPSLLLPTSSSLPYPYSHPLSLVTQSNLVTVGLQSWMLWTQGISISRTGIVHWIMQWYLFGQKQGTLLLPSKQAYVYFSQTSES